jgi:hypothetical protein
MLNGAALVGRCVYWQVKSLLCINPDALTTPREPKILLLDQEVRESYPRSSLIKSDAAWNPLRSIVVLTSITYL